MSIDTESYGQKQPDLMMRFRFDVLMATNSLIYTLYGISLVHRRAVQVPVGTFPTPDYPPLITIPYAITNSPFSERTAPGGPIEQIAYKAWITEVYDHIWESIYRPRFRRAIDENRPRGVPMETDPMGDIKLVRHDLIHSKSYANQCVKCKVLRWFNRGEHMRMELRHVLDFLNQMVLLNDNVRIEGDCFVMWMPLIESLSPSTEHPRLISVRPMYEPEESLYRYGASVVFQDGYFAMIPFVFQDRAEAIEHHWKSIKIDDNGDLYITPDYIVSAQQLYKRCFGPRTNGPGAVSPVFRIRK